MDIRTEQNAFREDLLHGKTAIVTGASRGIGAAIAHRLGEAGANVVLCSRSAEAVTQIANTLQGKGYTTYAMAADISEKADVEALLEKNDRSVFAHRYSREQRWDYPRYVTDASQR